MKIKVYCSKCGDLINEIELNNEIPETLKNHIICEKCYKENAIKKLLEEGKQHFYNKMDGGGLNR